MDYNITNVFFSFNLRRPATERKGWCCYFNYYWCIYDITLTLLSDSVQWLSIYSGIWHALSFWKSSGTFFGLQLHSATWTAFFVFIFSFICLFFVPFFLSCIHIYCRRRQEARSPPLVEKNKDQLTKRRTQNRLVTRRPQHSRKHNHKTKIVITPTYETLLMVSSIFHWILVTSLVDQVLYLLLFKREVVTSRCHGSKISER